MIWFIFWLAFTLFIVWLFAQSMRTAFRQQKSWELFARKHNLQYQRNQWFKAPSLDGVIKGRRMRLYVDEALDPVRRVREFRTTIELYFNNGFPTGLALGSRAYIDILGAIENVELMRLPPETAFANLMCVGRDTGIAMRYIEDHIESLKEFFMIPRSERLFMGHETDGFLILQTGESLDDVKALNEAVKKLFAIIEKLEPRDEGTALPGPDAPVTPALIAMEPAAPTVTVTVDMSADKNETETQTENDTKEEKDL